MARPTIILIIFFIYDEWFLICGKGIKIFECFFKSRFVFNNIRDVYPHEKLYVKPSIIACNVQVKVNIEG